MARPLDDLAESLGQQHLATEDDDLARDLVDTMLVLRRISTVLELHPDDAPYVPHGGNSGMVPDPEDATRGCPACQSAGACSTRNLLVGRLTGVSRG